MHFPSRDFNFNWFISALDADNLFILLLFFSLENRQFTALFLINLFSLAHRSAFCTSSTSSALRVLNRCQENQDFFYVFCIFWLHKSLQLSWDNKTEFDPFNFQCFTLFNIQFFRLVYFSVLHDFISISLFDCVTWWLTTLLWRSSKGQTREIRR